MSGCGGNIVAGCCPGPQGPPGPTGPTGPGGGGTAGVGVSISGNVAGAPTLVSTGTLVLAGGNNVTLSQNGQSITFSAGQSTQTQPAGSIAGIGISSATQAGSTLGATLSTNGLSLAVPQWITGGGGVDVSMGGKTAGVAGLVSTGTLVLAGGNNVTLSQNGNSITISANTAAAANLSVSAGSTTGAFGGLTFANGSNVSFGLNNGTITASVLAQSVQTQASGIIAGVGTTFNGANISGSMTLNTAGLNLSLSSPVETGIGLSAAGSSQAAGTVVLSNANGVSFGMVGSTVTASVAAGGGGGIDVTLGGNTSGALALVSTGTLFLAGGNNITLSQNGNSVTFSGANAGGAQTGISGLGVSNTTYTSGTVTLQNANGISFGSSGANGISASANFGVVGLQASNTTLTSGTVTLQNANGITFGSSGANGISASYNSTQFAGTGTTFNGANISGSITQNSAGINLSLSGPNESGVGITAAGSSQTAGNILFSNANGVSFGMAGSTVTASVVGGSAATTGGAYLQGNTTGQSSSSTYALSSLNVSGAGIISAGWSASTLIISAPGTTGLTQLSAGFSTGGNTAGTTGLASAQLVLAGGANITLSGSTNGGSMTVSIAGGAGGGGGIGLQVSNTTYTSGTITLQNANGITFGSSGAGGISASYNSTQFAGTGTTFNGANISGSMTLNSAGLNLSLSGGAGGGGGFSGGVSTGGNTAGNTGTYSGQVVFAGGNNITLSVSSGAAGAQSITVSGPNVATTAAYYFLGNTTGQSSSSTGGDQTLSFSAGGAISGGWSGGSILLSAPATSSISGTGQLSVSVNGSTVSLGVPNYGTLSYWDNGILNGAPLTTALGAGSVVLQAMVLDANLSVSALREFISGTFSNTNSSYGNTISVYGAIYTRNGSTLSLATSGSQSYALTNSSTASASIYTGIKGLTLPLAASLTPGNYWIGLMSNTASSGFNFATFNNVVASEGALTYNGALGSATSASNQVILGGGYFSTTSAALPASIGFSQITGSIANIAPFVNLYNVSA